LVTTTY